MEKNRQELRREYKERKKPAGIFHIKNTVNGKILLGSGLNLEEPLNAHKFFAHDRVSLQCIVTNGMERIWRR
jgi:hypothetical protein